MQEAQDRVRAALDGVRAIAHATYPPALDEAGLAAALDVLSEWRPHVEFGPIPTTRLPPELETGVYFIVAALTDSAAGDALVEAWLEDGDARIIVDVSRAAGGTLGDVEDRVGALGGSVTVDETTKGRTRVRVELTCA
ncbi:MAG: hypothetical protein H0U07_13345 [Actinobacteria bacterium]|nr:hypothetical protein [Actinomycetota bacterium]